MCESIIYIDDNEFEHFNVENLVKDYTSCSIKCFFSGEDALGFLIQQSDVISAIPDVVFLDLSMPGFTGWDFLEEFNKVKHKFSKQPNVYILSSTTDEDSINRSIRYPFVKRFLPKPLSPSIFDEL